MISCPKAFTPSGQICYLSKAFDANDSGTFITEVTTFLSHLSPGDIVLAENEFANIDQSGAIVVMPPRTKQNSGTGQGINTDLIKNKFGPVRVHTELVLQRLRMFKILQKRLNRKMVPHADKIIHMCAVLANFRWQLNKESKNGTAMDEDSSSSDVITLDDDESGSD